MKRVILLALLIVVLVVPNLANAAASTVMTNRVAYSTMFKTSWTSDGSGNVSDYTLSTDVDTGDFVGWYLYQVITDPGTTAPTANYDIVLKVYDVDISEGGLANRHTSNSELWVPDSPVQIGGDLTIDISNAGASKVGDIYLFFLRPIGGRDK